MKKIMRIKCGLHRRVYVRNGQILIVTDKEAEDMVAGGVGKLMGPPVAKNKMKKPAAKR